MDVRQLFAAALAQHRAGRLAEAEAGYRKVLSLSPGHADSLHLAGVVASQSGRHREAVALIGRAIALSKAEPAEFHNSIALAYRGLGEHVEALRHFERAVALKPDYGDAHLNLSAILLDLGRLDEAELHGRRAVALKPNAAEARFALGAVQHWQGRLDDAVTSYLEAIRVRPSYPEAWCNLGAVRQDQHAFDEAAAALAEALRLRPNYAKAHYNQGSLLQEQGRVDEALACYRRAQALAPDDADAHWNEALLRLARGEFPAGWAKYEWRWRRKGNAPRPLPMPPWQGEPLAGRSILLHAEQGFGDTIQFVRYARLVKDKDASSVVVECQPELARLLGSCAGIDRIVARGGPAPSADCHAPLPSLPGLFGTTLDTIPADIPYLAADPELVAAWRQRLGPGPNVGLVWRGNRLNTRDASRSIAADRIAPLLTVSGFNWVSLQNDARPDELSTLSRYGKIRDFGAELTDWADTAALVCALDLVITVDTAVGHLAGALGRPAWIMLAYVAHWCWLTGRSDSPWYPTARLFRQSPRRAWDKVLAEIRRELAQL